MTAEPIEPFWPELLRELRASQFADLEGAEAAVVLPVSDDLITRLLRARMPSGAPVRDLDVRSIGDNTLAVQFRLKQPTFLPPITIRLRIEVQPDLPGAPVIGLRVLSQGVAALAGPAARLFPFLPPGVSLDGDRMTVRLDTLLRRFGAAEVLPYLSTLEIHAAPHRLIVTVRAALPAGVRMVGPGGRTAGDAP